MVDSKDDAPGGERRKERSRSMPGLGQVRLRVAQVVWGVCLVFALFLAVGALTYALKANPDNGLVDFVRSWADKVDLGVFTIENGIKEFVGKNSDIKNSLFNWGLGALFWLVVGRLLERVIRP
jgi:hypothetical protein